MERLDGVVRTKPYVRDHRWMVWLADGYIDGVLFVVTPDTALSTTDQWRTELRRNLRRAAWH